MHSESSRQRSGGLVRPQDEQGAGGAKVGYPCVVLILISLILNYYRENITYYSVLLSISEFTWNSYNIQIIINLYTLNPGLNLIDSWHVTEDLFYNLKTPYIGCTGL